MIRLISPWRLFVLLVAGSLLLGGGCGSSGKSPVSGRVTLTDGTPVTAGIVSFQAAQGKGSAVGIIDTKGYFEMCTLEPGDGVPPGEYQVAILPTSLFGPPAMPGEDVPPPPPPAHAEKYCEFETSELEFTVKKGKNTFEIQLDPR